MRRFAVVALVIVAATAVYLVTAVLARPTDEDRALPQAVTESLPLGTLFLRDTRDGPSFGHVGLVSDGSRTTTARRCDRLDVAPDLTMSCLEAVPGVTLRSKVSLVTKTGEVEHSWQVPGVPSRTRLSPSGEHWAVTTFVTGHSYASARFSTLTVIGVTQGGKPVNLEDFTLTIEGQSARPVDRNFWGVTFADDRTFYATVASGKRTWLVKGDLVARTVRTIHDQAECPALSPDQTRVAYKKRDVVPGATWTLAVLDLASGEETLLTGERTSVDDQVTWLDDETLLYGKPHDGKPGTSDVWAIGADVDAEPRLYVEGASSPSAPAML